MLVQRLCTWWIERQIPTESKTLSYSTIYLLPTRAGLMFAVTLLVLLVVTINYQINLGYALTFLLLGAAGFSMHLSNHSLRGLTLQIGSVNTAFAQQPCSVELMLNPSRVSSTNAQHTHFAVAAGTVLVPRQSIHDVSAQNSGAISLVFTPEKRGYQLIAPICVETYFPLGFFRAFSLWRPNTEILVYPQVETPTPPLPKTPTPAFEQTSAALQRQTQGGDPDGVRTYRRGDSLKQIAWKKSATQLQVGAELVSRTRGPLATQELQLHWQQCAHLGLEQQLSRLTAWVLAAQALQAHYGLVLPHAEIPPGTGQAHMQHCLTALALCSQA
jgi:uncharacterized protein (DUF58 family)